MIRSPRIFDVLEGCVLKLVQNPTVSFSHYGRQVIFVQDLENYLQSRKIWFFAGPRLGLFLRVVTVVSVCLPSAQLFFYHVFVPNYPQPST